MKITRGVFPWALFYGPLVAALFLAAAALTATQSWHQPVFPWLGYGASVFTGWWAFLAIRSEVVAGRSNTYRNLNPVLFWVMIALYVSLAALFIFFSLTS